MPVVNAPEAFTKIYGESINLREAFLEVFTQGWNSAVKAGFGAAAETSDCHRILWPEGGFWADFKDGRHRTTSGDLRARCVQCEKIVLVTHD